MDQKTIFDLFLSWLPFLVLIVVWIVLSRQMKARGQSFWSANEAQIAEMKRTNALLERIAVTLEKRAQM